MKYVRKSATCANQIRHGSPDEGLGVFRCCASFILVVKKLMAGNPKLQGLCLALSMVGGIAILQTERTAGT